MVSLVYVLGWLFLAVFAYFVIPDSSPNANSQYPEIAGSKAFTKVQFIGVGEGETQLIPLEKGMDGKLRTFDGEEVTANAQRHLTQKLFIFGTDRFGRDVLSRLILGSRYSLAVGFVSVIISIFIGTLLGALAGYFRGWVDAVISWFTTVIWSVPLMLLVIAITLALGKGLFPLFLAVGLATWVDVARIVRGQILSLREKEYIEACRAFGYSHFRIIFFHILPNLTGILLVLATSNFASAILLESGLNFLGLGAQPPIPTWGNMIRDHIGYLFAGNIWAMMLPAGCIFSIVLAFSTIGNALRDALDVKYLAKS